ncbi:MAG: hypothetical protein V3U88_12105 [Methylococcales bacterium]
MDRRNFIRISSIGTATGIIAPTPVLACADTMAGGVYYTKDAPGRWSKKVKGHWPNLEISRKDKQTDIRVVTLHEMLGYEHYIIKHMVLDKNFRFIAEQLFDPIKNKKPVSEFSLGDYSGRVHVLSVCNTHDSWLNLVDI